MYNIKIENIEHGWLDFTIKDKTFTVSYLSDFIKDMKNLLTFEQEYNDNQVNRIYLEGEGIELHLTAWRVMNKLFIVWEYWLNDVEFTIMRFSYVDFVKEFNEKFEEIKESYYNNFDLNTMKGR